MNPDSSSVIELGTIDHPYKQLSYAMIEILNYHSHSDSNLTVNIMEYTVNELRLQTASIINIKHVDVVPYTHRDSAPDKATIMSIDKGNIVETPGTQFNIMKSFELRIQEQVHDSSSLTFNEKERINIHDYSFVIVRSNFMIQNMYLTSNYISTVIDPVFFFFVYVQEK